MSTERGSAHDGRDVDAEFTRMLQGEGLEVQPGEAPREPAAQDAPDVGVEDDADRDSLWSFSADSPPEPPSAESVARSRAAHPAAGGPGIGPGRAEPAVPRELDDDEVIYGDFEPPDPDLPTPSDRTMWSWTALLGGFVLILAVTVTSSLPMFLGWLGGLAALGGTVSLLLRAPREPRDDGDDGAQL